MLDRIQVGTHDLTLSKRNSLRMGENQFFPINPVLFIFHIAAQIHFATEEISSQLQQATEEFFKLDFIQKLNIPTQNGAVNQVTQQKPFEYRTEALFKWQTLPKYQAYPTF